MFCTCILSADWAFPSACKHVAWHKCLPPRIIVDRTPGALNVISALSNVRSAISQNLLIITAIKADKTRVKDYIHRLDNFDGPAVGEIAVGYEMFEEAFEIYKKFGLKVMAIKVCFTPEYFH